MEKRILHIDVNNAFLSWTAVDRLKKGDKVDLRKIASVIGGDESQRKGIVVAKSNIAKQFGIKTADPIYQARKKCPSIIVVPGDYKLYRKCSNELYEFFCRYTNKIERFSIDECFLDLTEFIKPNEDIIKKAFEIKESIKKEFGYTVNIGISDDKILAKVASDFEKPDKVHTLFRNQIKEKLWNLPVSDLFMVGKKSIPKLNRMGIRTIGDLANYDKILLNKNFGKYGNMIWNYANGNSREEVNYEVRKPKGIGNSTTLPYDVSDFEKLWSILICLTDQVCYRLRKEKMLASIVNITLKNSNFKVYSHQKKIGMYTDSSKEILKVAKNVLQELYTGDNIRLIGIRVDGLIENEEVQLSIFDNQKEIKYKKIDDTLDKLKEKYGYNIITRAGEIKSNYTSNKIE